MAQQVKDLALSLLWQQFNLSLAQEIPQTVGAPSPPQKKDESIFCLLISHSLVCRLFQIDRTVVFGKLG